VQQQSRSSGACAGLLSVFALAVLPAGAAAAPVTVDLRIEGPTKTVFEGRVTSDLRPFRFTDDAKDYPCDATDANTSNGGTTPATNRGNILSAAQQEAGFTMTGTWFDKFGPSFDEIGGEKVAYDSVSKSYLVEYKNGKASEFGSCGDVVANGDSALFAYGNGSEPLLALAGPASAKPGETVEVAVTDGKDGKPVSGAAVGGRTTGTDGVARIVVDRRGDNVYKATKSGAIRSNRVVICASDGQDGFCGTRRPDGTTAPEPGTPPSSNGAPAPASPGPAVAAPGRDTGRDTGRPVGRVTGVRTGQAFTRSSAPRELAVSATDPSGVSQVKLRLTRRHRGRCAYLSGRKDRFVSARCGRSFAFKASDRGEFTYLLPERLTPGRYVLDVVAVDRAGNRDELARGRSRIVFTVR